MRLTAQEQKLEDDIVQFLLLRNKDLPFDPVPESELLPPRLPWSRPIAQKSHSRDGIRRWDHNFIAEEPFEETFERHGPGAWSLSQNPTYATVPPPEPKRTKIAGHRYRKRTQAQPRRPQTVHRSTLSRYSSLTMFCCSRQTRSAIVALSGIPFFTRFLRTSSSMTTIAVISTPRARWLRPKSGQRGSFVKN